MRSHRVLCLAPPSHYIHVGQQHRGTMYVPSGLAPEPLHRTPLMMDYAHPFRLGSYLGGRGQAGAGSQEVVVVMSDLALQPALA